MLRAVRSIVVATLVAILSHTTHGPGTLPAAEAEADHRVVVIAESADIHDQSRVIDTIPIGTVLAGRGARGPWLLVQTKAPGWIRSDQVAAIEKAVPLLAKTVRDRAADRGTRARAAMAMGEIGEAATPAITDLIRVLEDDYDVASVQDAVARALVKLGPPVVPPLLDSWKHGRLGPESWDAFTTVVRGIGPPAGEAAPILIGLLDESDDIVRAAAVRALGRLGLAAEPAVPRLVEALREPRFANTSDAARDALEHLGTVAESAVPQLVVELKGGGYLQRERCLGAAEALGLIGASARQAVPALIDTMDGSDRRLCEVAIEALGRIGPDARAAVPKLVDSLGDRDAFIRIAAINALGRLGPAIAPELPRLVEIALRDPENSVKVWAAAALGRLGPVAAPAMAELTAAVEDKDAEVRTAGVMALGQLGPIAAPAVPKLVEALRDDEDAVRWAAAVALGRLGPAATPAVPKLVEALSDRSIIVRRCAATALGRLAPSSSAAVLALAEAALHADEDSLRDVAAEALGQLGPAVEPALSEFGRALNNADERGRAAAAGAAGRLGGHSRTLLPVLARIALRDSVPHVRRVAAESLGRIPPDLQLDLPRLIETQAGGRDSLSQSDPSTLEAIGPPALPALIATLTDRRQPLERRTLAASAIGQMGYRAKEAVPSMVHILTSASEPSLLRDSVADELGQIGDVVTPKLSEVFADEHHGLEDRIAAARILGTRLLRRGPPTLVRLCANKGSDWRLRRLALQLLSELEPTERPAEFGKIVSAIISDAAENAALREAAIEAFGRSTPKEGEAVDPAALAAVLRSPEEGPGLREAAIESLDRLGKRAAAAIGSLLSVLSDKRGDAALRAMILPALERIDPQAPGVAGTLIALLTDEQEDRDLRIAACRALAAVDSPNAGQALDVFGRATRDDDLREEAELARVSRSDRLKSQAEFELLRKQFGEMQDATPAIVVRPRMRPHKPLTVSARVGSERMPGRLIDSYLSFEPRAGPGPAALEVVGRDSFEFRVREFEQPPAIAASGFQVDRAGAIVADAIARQLGAWGFEVLLEINEKERDRDEVVLRFDAEGHILDAENRAPEPPARPATVDISGEVRFEVDHIPGKDCDATTARLEARVVVVGTREGRRVPLFEQSFQEVETISGERRAGRYERGQKAASITLGRFVEKLLGDPELQRKLVAFGSPRPG